MPRGAASTARRTRSPPTTRRTPRSTSTSSSAGRPTGSAASRRRSGIVLAAVDAGVLPLARAIEALTTGPAAVLGGASTARRRRRRSGTASPADLVVIDRGATWTVARRRRCARRARTRRCWGASCAGVVRLTIAGGPGGLPAPERPPRTRRRRPVARTRRVTSSTTAHTSCGVCGCLGVTGLRPRTYQTRPCGGWRRTIRRGLGVHRPQGRRADAAPTRGRRRSVRRPRASAACAVAQHPVLRRSASIAGPMNGADLVRAARRPRRPRRGRSRPRSRARGARSRPGTAVEPADDHGAERRRRRLRRSCRRWSGGSWTPTGTRAWTCGPRPAKPSLPRSDHGISASDRLALAQRARAGRSRRRSRWAGSGCRGSPAIATTSPRPSVGGRGERLGDGLHGEAVDRRRGTAAAGAVRDSSGLPCGTATGADEAAASRCGAALDVGRGRTVRRRRPAERRATPTTTASRTSGHEHAPARRERAPAPGGAAGRNGLDDHRVPTIRACRATDVPGRGGRRYPRADDRDPRAAQRRAAPVLAGDDARAARPARPRPPGRGGRRRGRRRADGPVRGASRRGARCERRPARGRADRLGRLDAQRRLLPPGVQAVAHDAAATPRRPSGRPPCTARRSRPSSTSRPCARPPSTPTSTAAGTSCSPRRPSHAAGFEDAATALRGVDMAAHVVPRADLRTEIGSDAYFGGPRRRAQRRAQPGQAHRRARDARRGRRRRAPRGDAGDPDPAAGRRPDAWSRRRAAPCSRAR